MTLATRVRQTTTGTGTGDLVLGAAPNTYVDFASLYSDGSWAPYTIVGDGQWEEGTAPVAGGVLQRSLGRVFTSSAAGALVDFKPGTKTVDGFLGDHQIATRLAAEKTAANGGGGGGGGGGGAVTIADGASVALGARNATPANDDTGTHSLIALMKRALQKIRSAGRTGGSDSHPVVLSNEDFAQITSIAGLQIPPHNHITLGYTGSDLTSVTYRSGGAGGTVVATLTLAYTSGNLTSIARS